MTPVLETERLVLRARVRDDFPAYVELWQDPAVYRSFGEASLPREEIWSKFTRQAGLWSLAAYGFFIVVEKLTGAVVGEVGGAQFMREIDPPLGDDLEFGWVFSGRAQGKGYATEAVRAALACADGRFPGASFACIINPDNASSIRVAEKSGFREERRSFYKGADVIIMKRRVGR